jgi:hypothetical protein
MVFLAKYGPKSGKSIEKKVWLSTYSFAISWFSSKIIGMMVTLSFFGGLRCVLSVLFWLPIQYMHQPMMNIKISSGRSIILNALLRLRLLFEVANIAPDYFSIYSKISFDYSE